MPQRTGAPERAWGVILYPVLPIGRRTQKGAVAASNCAASVMMAVAAGTISAGTAFHASYIYRCDP